MQVWRTCESFANEAIIMIIIRAGGAVCPTGRVFAQSAKNKIYKNFINFQKPPQRSGFCQLPYKLAKLTCKGLIFMSAGALKREKLR